MPPLIYHASYSQLALPSQHRFPTSKYQRLYQFLLEHKLANKDDFHTPSSVDIEFLKQIHCPDYVAQFFIKKLSPQAIRRLGFPLSDGLVTRSLHSVAGTMLACDLAMSSGIALQLSGGYHHAHYHFGSGYCVFNDLIAGAVHSLARSDVDKVLIFDCDVHQGDGTATMAQAYPDIISCSVHCQENFPARKQRSDHDIELERGSGDALYLETITQTLALVIRLHQPDLIIYDAGVDVHQQDDLGHLALSTQGIFERDLLVLSMAKASNIPIACVIGGGYSKQPLELSKRHAQVFIAANKLW